MAYIKRAVKDTIARVSKMFPVLLVTGPRQVGIVNLLGLSDAEIYHEPSEPFQTEAGYLMERLSVKRKKGFE